MTNLNEKKLCTGMAVAARTFSEITNRRFFLLRWHAPGGSHHREKNDDFVLDPIDRTNVRNRSFLQMLRISNGMQINGY